MVVSNTSKPCHLHYSSKTQKGAKHLLSGQGLPLWFHEHTSSLYRSLLSQNILVDVVNRSRLLHCKRAESVDYVRAIAWESKPT